MEPETIYTDTWNAATGFNVIKNPLIIVMDINGANITAGFCYNGIFLGSIYSAPTPIFDPHSLNFEDYLKVFSLKITGALKDCHTMPRNENPGHEVIEHLIQEIGLEFLPIGVSFSGQVSSDGKIYSASSIFRGRQPRDFNLKTIIQEHYPSSEVFILNNISAAAWKYSQLEAMEKYQRFLVIHIGSGFGSKIFDNLKKEIIIDSRGMSGELGHIFMLKEPVFEKYQFICDCGNPNHLAAFILPSGLINLFDYYQTKYHKEHPGKEKIGANRYNIINNINENFESTGKYILEYVAGLLGKAISLVILAIGIDKLVIKGSLFAGLTDNYRAFFVKALNENIKELLKDYYSISDDFIMAKLARESDDRKDSLEGMFTYINHYFSTAHMVSRGYCFNRPAFGVSCKRDVFYPIIRTDDLFNTENDLLRNITGNRQTLIILDNNYNDKQNGKLSQSLQNYFAGKDHLMIGEIDPGNRSTGEKKDMDNVLQVIEFAREFKLPRDGLLIAIGGGVILDIVGFAAQQYRRMVDYIKIPTTLIGQIDAGIGVKVGVNYKEGKNLIGAFYPPMLVINHIPFLYDLPDEQFACGMAEIIKIGIINSKTIIHDLTKMTPRICGTELKNNAVLRKSFLRIMDESIQKMLLHLQKNLFEKEELRRAVDFGHTFSPIIESESNYKIQHGYAVAVDMIISNFIARELNLIPKELFKNYGDVLKKYRLFNYPALLDEKKQAIFEEAVAKTIQHRGGNLNLVVPVAECGKSGFINLNQCDDLDSKNYCMIIKKGELYKLYCKAVEYLKFNAERCFYV